MKKESLSVVFACFLGSLIGGLSALEISQYFTYGKYLWGIGALLGGLTAYIAVDFHKFCAGFAKSYQESKENLVYKYKQIVEWKPDSEYWKTMALMEAGLICMSTSLAMVSISLGYFASFNERNGYSFYGSILFMCAVASFIVMAAGCVLMFTLPYSYTKTPYYKRKEEYQETRHEAVILIKYCNPVSFFLVLCYIVFSSLYFFGIALWNGFPNFASWAVTVVRLVWVACRQFFVNGFIYVHSDRRTLCFVDATIGASFGFGFGSAIVGAFVGAMLGLVNYEFVSVRMLKLAPKKAE